MSMETLKTSICELADKELNKAVEKWGLNHSDHESAAVLLEEIEEAREEQINIEVYYKYLWDGIKKNALPEEMRANYSRIFDIAVNLACEAVQVAAMARKGVLSNIDIYEEGQGDE